MYNWGEPKRAPQTLHVIKFLFVTYERVVTFRIFKLFELRKFELRLGTYVYGFVTLISFVKYRGPYWLTAFPTTPYLWQHIQAGRWCLGMGTLAGCRPDPCLSELLLGLPDLLFLWSPIPLGRRDTPDQLVAPCSLFGGIRLITPEISHLAQEWGWRSPKQLG